MIALVLEVPGAVERVVLPDRRAAGAERLADVEEVGAFAGVVMVVVVALRVPLLDDRIAHALDPDVDAAAQERVDFPRAPGRRCGTRCGRSPTRRRRAASCARRRRASWPAWPSAATASMANDFASPGANVAWKISSSGVPSPSLSTTCETTSRPCRDRRRAPSSATPPAASPRRRVHFTARSRRGERRRACSRRGSGRTARLRADCAGQHSERQLGPNTGE